MFADDTNIFYSNSCLKTLNKIIQLEIDKMADWLNVNKLSINTTKTKFMLFRSSKTKHKHNITITINNNIKQVKNTTFLGIIIDECLTWNEHVDMISKKIIKSACLITRI